MEWSSREQSLEGRTRLKSISQMKHSKVCPWGKPVQQAGLPVQQAGRWNIEDMASWVQASRPELLTMYNPLGNGPKLQTPESKMPETAEITETHAHFSSTYS